MDYCGREQAFELDRGWISGFRFVAPGFALLGAVSLFVVTLGGALAQEAAPSSRVKIELNKIEQTDKGCRFYWLVNNQSSEDIESLDVSFYWFQKDGIIGGDLRFAFAPAASKSLRVKQYIVPDQDCKDLASLLVNEVGACTSGAGPISDCAKQLTYASRTSVQFLQ